MSGHDCGWLECTLQDCQQQRNRVSDEILYWSNVTRNGQPAGNPQCGDVNPDMWGRINPMTCTKTEGHPGDVHNCRGITWFGSLRTPAVKP